MLLAQGPHWSRDVRDHLAQGVANLGSEPTLPQSTIMRAKKRMMRGQRRDGLVLARGLKEGCVEGVV